MFARIFIILFILLLGSIIWWPGLADHTSFNRHAEIQIDDTSQKLESFLTLADVELSGLRDSVSSVLSKVTGGAYLPEADDLDAAHEAPMESFFNRLWSSPYFMALKAMLELSMIRAVLALIWFAALCPILLTVVFDAWVVRRLKYESFASHHPTLYQTALSASPVLLTCAFTVMLIPFAIPVWVSVVFYAAFLLSTHVIVSNFHRFG